MSEAYHTGVPAQDGLLRSSYDSATVMMDTVELTEDDILHLSDS